MRQTIADSLREEGWKEGRRKGREEEAVRSRRKILLHQLDTKFGDLPADTVATIKKTASIEQLDEWLSRLVNAVTLAEVGIGEAT
jgi:hypothetical protein